MLKLGEAITRKRKLILVVAVLLLIPSVLGMIATRINYDVLSYLPDDIQTIKGQDILLDDFGKVRFRHGHGGRHEPEGRLGSEEQI